MGRNITLKLDEGLIRKARVLAAQKGTSVSGLLTHYLKQLLKEEEAYETTRKRALAFLDRGFHFGGRILSTRDEWHER